MEVNISVGTMNSTDNVSIHFNESTTTLSSVLEPTTQCSPWSEPLCDALLIATHYFVSYGTYIAYASGIPGNFLTLLILIKMTPFNSSIIWLIALTFTDLLNLVIRFAYGRAVTGSSQELFEDWSCRLFFIVCRTCNFTSYLYVVGLTFERFIAVQFPLKMNQWCTVKRSILGVTICLTICLGMSMYIPEVYRASGNRSCVLRSKYSYLWGLVYESYIQTTILVLLPFFLLAVLNGLIVRRLVIARKLQKAMSETHSKEKIKQQRQINRMLIANSICLFICVMPDILFQYYKIYIEVDEYGSRASAIMLNTFSVFKVYNSAANFFLYITAAHKFRNELIRLLTCNRYGNSRQKGNTTKYISETKSTTDGYSQSVK